MAAQARPSEPPLAGWAVVAGHCWLPSARWDRDQEEQERAQARAAASAEQRIIKPHFRTADPCQSQLPLGLFDAKPDIFIYISF